MIAIACGLLVWTFRCLGKNLTDTVVTRQKHTLIIHGPYRWVRHPFYDSAALFAVAASLIAANWFLFVTGVVLFCLFIIEREPKKRTWWRDLGTAIERTWNGPGAFCPELERTGVAPNIALEPGGAAGLVTAARLKCQDGFDAADTEINRFPPVARALIRLRLFLGRIFRLEAEPKDALATSFGSRLTAEDRARSFVASGTPEGLFRVRQSTWITPFYMGLIDPFRKWIIYPAMLKKIRAIWDQNI